VYCDLGLVMLSDADQFYIYIWQNVNVKSVNENLVQCALYKKKTKVNRMLAAELCARQMLTNTLSSYLQAVLMLVYD